MLRTCHRPPVLLPGLVGDLLRKPEDWAAKPSAAGDSNAHTASAGRALLPWLRGPKVGTILN